MPDSTPPPPPGFVIDSKPSGGTPAPPPGFVLDGPANPPAPAAPSIGHKAALKQLGKNTALMGASMAPVMAGAESGAEVGSAFGPVGTAIGGVAGAAFGGLAVPAAQYLTQRVMGEQPAKPTASDMASSAKTNAIFSMLPSIGEQALIGASIKGVERVLGIEGASELADKGAAGAAEAGAQLSEQQTKIKSEIAGKKIQAAQGAIKEHADTIAQAEDQVSKARDKLLNNTADAAEKARAAAAEQITESLRNAAVTGMVGKTPEQFEAEAAQPYDQRAQARSRAIDPVFDASAKFHEEVGAKFEPYIGKIKNDDVGPAARENFGGMTGRIDQTLNERGQKIESPELRGILKKLEPSKADLTKFKFPDDTAVLGGELGDIKDPLKRRAQEEMLIKSGLEPPKGEEPEELTYGQLWGYRARANKVLATARNPADRWAAREVISEINDAIPGVPQEIRNQYAYERTMAKSVLGKVASARTPQEAGDTIFGSKSNPEPAEVPLSVIRFTQQYAPEKMDGLREAFADRYLGGRMDANDLTKINRNVLTELYGDNADSVIRLIGPEGDMKQASWGDLFKADPAARAAFEKAVGDSANKQASVTAKQAIESGQKMLQGLPSQFDYIQKAMNNVHTPPEKLAILAKAMPDIEAARQAAVREGASPGKLTGRFESYLQRRLAFMGLMAALGGYGVLSKHPSLVTAALVMGAGTGIRGGARAALATETGSSLYLKALDIRPTAANAATFGRIVGPIIAAGATLPPAPSGK